MLALQLEAVCGGGELAAEGEKVSRACGGWFKAERIKEGVKIIAQGIFGGMHRRVEGSHGLDSSVDRVF